MFKPYILLQSPSKLANCYEIDKYVLSIFCFPQKKTIFGSYAFMVNRLIDNFFPNITDAIPPVGYQDNGHPKHLMSIIMFRIVATKIVEDSLEMECRFDFI